MLAVSSKNPQTYATNQQSMSKTITISGSKYIEGQKQNKAESYDVSEIQGSKPTAAPRTGAGRRAVKVDGSAERPTVVNIYETSQ